MLGIPSGPDMGWMCLTVRSLLGMPEERNGEQEAESMKQEYFLGLTITLPNGSEASIQLFDNILRVALLF